MTSGSIIISAKHSLSHGQAGISFELANMEISSAQYNKAQLWPTAREQSTDRREGRGGEGSEENEAAGLPSGGGKRRKGAPSSTAPAAAAAPSLPTHACLLAWSCTSLPVPFFCLLGSSVPSP